MLQVSPDIDDNEILKMRGDDLKKRNVSSVLHVVIFELIMLQTIVTLVILTDQKNEEILHGKLHFLCSDYSHIRKAFTSEIIT